MKGDWDFSGSLIWSNALMELIFNPLVNFGEVQRAQLAKYSPHFRVGTPRIFKDLLRSVQMLTREWGAERNGKLPLLFIPSKTTTLVHEFAVEDLPLDRTSTLVPAFAVKDLPLGRTL